MFDIRRDVPFPYNQCWICGYTPKCCACKFYDFDGTKNGRDDHICLKHKKMKHYYHVAWNYHCCYWEWSWKDDENIQLRIL